MKIEKKNLAFVLGGVLLLLTGFVLGRQKIITASSLNILIYANRYLQWSIDHRKLRQKAYRFIEINQLRKFLELKT